jgi:hypothetical protein
MNDITKLSARFSSLQPAEKAMFLARVAHMATIDARASYISTPAHPARNFEYPDAIVLRDANNFVHRVTGYIMHVLDRSEGTGQDESVIEMIVAWFGPTRPEPSNWLGIAQKS